ETGPASLARVAVQRELRHDQHTATRLGEIAIHLPFGIAEDAQAEDLLGHPAELCISVRRGKTRQNKKAGTDPSGYPAFDSNLGAFDSLEDDPHSTVTLFARF